METKQFIFYKKIKEIENNNTKGWWEKEEEEHPPHDPCLLDNCTSTLFVYKFSLWIKEQGIIKVLEQED